MKRFFFVSMVMLMVSHASLVVADDSLFTIATPPATIDPPELVAYWPFDGSLSNTIFDDVTGHGYNASISSGSLSLKQGIIGNAIHFPGSGYELVAEHSATDFNLPQFSIEVLFYSNINPAQLPEEAYIFNQQYINSGVRNGYGVFVHKDGKVDFGMATSGGGGYVEALSATRMQSKKWYHIVATFDAANLKLYINGVLEGTAAYSGMYPPSTADARIGCQRLQDGTLRDFNNGMFDELKLYNRALSADMVAAHFASYNIPLDPPPTLIAHWPFDASFGNTIFYDVSGHGHDAFASGNSFGITDGICGKALECRGPANESMLGVYDIQIQNSLPDFNLPAFSIEAWAYSYENLDNPGSFFNQRAIFENISCGPGIAGGYSLKILENGKPIFCWGSATDASWMNVMADSIMAPNRWYHFAATCDGSVAMLYVNGRAAAQKSSYDGYAFSTKQARIGCELLINSADTSAGVTRQFFNGKIDELKLYNYTLDGKTILSHYKELASSTMASVTPQLQKADGFVVNKALRFTHAGEKPITMTIWNFNGRCLEKRTIQTGTRDVDLSGLSRGSYIYRLRNGSSTRAGRLMVNR